MKDEERKPLQQGQGRLLMPNGDPVILHRASVWELSNREGRTIALHRPLAHEAISRTDIAMLTIELSDAARIAIGELQHGVVVRCFGVHAVRFYRNRAQLYVWSVRGWSRSAGGRRPPSNWRPGCVVAWDEVALREPGRRASANSTALSTHLTRQAFSGRDSRAGARC